MGNICFKDKNFNKQHPNLCESKKQAKVTKQNKFDAENMLKIGILGQGGQANVQLYYDFKNKKRYALKCFSDSYQYLSEKKMHIKYLMEDKNSNLASFVCQLASFKDVDSQLLFETGLCSLNEANQIFKINNCQNIVIYHDQDDLVVQQAFGFQLQDFRNIQIKLIDFGSCSDDPYDYYNYVTKKYKYLGYLDQDLDLKKILFAETYSACKSIYFLLDEQLIYKMQNINCDLKSVMSQSKDSSQENNLLFFLLIFLGQNEIQSIFSKKGISIDNLTYLTQKYLGQVNQTNQHFKLDSFDVLQRGQWNKINELDYSIHNQTIEYKIIHAFAFKNNLKQIFSEQFYQDNLNHKMSKIISLIETFEITSIYDSFSEEELSFVEQEIIKKYHILNEESYLQFVQLACILYCHSQQNHYISIKLHFILSQLIKPLYFNNQTGVRIKSKSKSKQQTETNFGQQQMFLNTF